MALWLLGLLSGWLDNFLARSLAERLIRWFALFAAWASWLSCWLSSSLEDGFVLMSVLAGCAGCIVGWAFLQAELAGLAACPGSLAG
jgi:hypothetical protein